MAIHNLAIIVLILSKSLSMWNKEIKRLYDSKIIRLTRRFTFKFKRIYKLIDDLFRSLHLKIHDLTEKKQISKFRNNFSLLANFFNLTQHVQTLKSLDRIALKRSFNSPLAILHVSQISLNTIRYFISFLSMR